MSDLAGALALRADESELIAELQAGSERAFNQLLAQYGHPVYSLIASSLRDPADVTQEVFVKVFRNIATFHGDSSLRTWIYRIALHETSNQRRWWNRHKKQELTIDAPIENEEGEACSLADALATTDASPFDLAARAQLHARVAAALATLAEPFRQVIVLREIEGFGYEEIAEILDLNLGTVKSRLTRARAQLRTALAPPTGCPIPKEAHETGCPIHDGSIVMGGVNTSNPAATAGCPGHDSSIVMHGRTTTPLTPAVSQ